MCIRDRFYTVFVLIVFYALHLYKSLWRFASFSELNRIFASSVITTVFHIVCITLLIKRMPISYYVIGAAMQLALVTAIRFAYRYITLERTRRERSVKAVHNVMVIGAGAAGQVILKEMCIRDRSCCTRSARRCRGPRQWRTRHPPRPAPGWSRS